MSPVLHTPIVGAWHRRQLRARSTARLSGGMLARYQLSAGVSDPLASSSAITASASGWPAHARKLAQSSADSHCSAMPANWNSSMYHDFSCCSKPPCAERRRMTDRQRHEMVDAVGRERGEGPRHRRAPVVADDVRPLDADVVEDGRATSPASAGIE